MRLCGRALYCSILLGFLLYILVCLLCRQTRIYSPRLTRAPVYCSILKSMHPSNHRAWRPVSGPVTLLRWTCGGPSSCTPAASSCTTPAPPALHSCRGPQAGFDGSAHRVQAMARAGLCWSPRLALSGLSQKPARGKASEPVGRRLLTAPRRLWPAHALAHCDSALSRVVCRAACVRARFCACC